VNQYTLLAQLFARAALTGGPAPIPLEDSVKNLLVLDALRRSAASGRWEEV
jgi:predicted dehydrogenase